MARTPSQIGMGVAAARAMAIPGMPSPMGTQSPRQGSVRNNNNNKVADKVVADTSPEEVTGLITGAIRTA